jgi:2,5-dihydroxypyridine 5,6-dioxygenase
VPDDRFGELLNIATESVTLCRVRADERVVVYTDERADMIIAEAWYAACAATGSDVALLRAAARPDETDPPAAVVAAMIQADVVFDVASSDQGYAPAMRRIMASGTRMLQILMPADAVARRAPDSASAWRADVSADLLRGASTVRVTTSAGTNLRAALVAERPLDVARGYVRDPGQWDSFGTTLIACAPLETSVQGHLVIDGPLIMLPDDSFVPDAPIHCDVADGQMVSLDASHGAAARVDGWLRAFDDPAAYSFSHIGWGLDPNATIEDGELTTWESLFATVMVAFGANNSPNLGGVVESLAHMDGVLLDASLWLDDLPVLLDGEFAPGSGLEDDATRA